MLHHKSSGRPAGISLQDDEQMRPLDPKVRVGGVGGDEEAPLHRPRPPEEEGDPLRHRQKDRVLLQNGGNRSDNVCPTISVGSSNPWTRRLSQRASVLWQQAYCTTAAAGLHQLPPPTPAGCSDSKRKFTCRDMVCLCLVPCVVIAIFLLAISTLTTYFGVKMGMQGKVDRVRQELAEQRQRDGGVFMSLDRRDEMEEKLSQLDRLKRELEDLSTRFRLKSADNERLSQALQQQHREGGGGGAGVAAGGGRKNTHFSQNNRGGIQQQQQRDMDLAEVTAADQQYNDLDMKARNGGNRKNEEKKKSKMEEQRNAKSISSERFHQLNSLLEGRVETLAKMCDAFGSQREEVLKKSGVSMQKSVEEWAGADGQIKEAMAKVDGLSAAHMHSEQLFLSLGLKKAQVVKDEETAKLQGHLTKSLAAVQEMESSVGQLQKTNEAAMTGFTTFTAKLQGEHLTSMKKREDLIGAVIGRQKEHHVKDIAIRNEVGREIEELQELIMSYKAERDAVSSSIRSLQSVVDGLELKMEKASVRAQHLAKRLTESAKETQQGMNVAESAVKTLRQIESTGLLALEEAVTRASGEMLDHYKDQTAVTKQLIKTLETDREVERDFVLGCQEREKARYEELELKFRERSDESPKQLIKVQDLTRQVQKVSSESLRQLESRAESYAGELQRWREDSGKEADGFCMEISAMDVKSREALEEALAKEWDHKSQVAGR